MLFSIIIPTYNRKDKLLKCLESLYVQDFPKDKYEVIVVDDCSTDDTYRLLSKQKVTLLKLEKRMGPSVARNFGASKAKGKYLVFTDSDCLVTSDWLKKIYEGYKNYPNVIAVGGGVINKSKSVFGKYENFIYRSYIRENSSYISTKRDELPFALGNISYVKDFFMDIGGFNEKIPYCCSGEDALLKEKALKRRKKFLYLPINVVHNHDFSFKGFLRQSEERGCGMLFHSKVKGKMQSRYLIYARLLFTPFYILYSIIKLKFNLQLIFCDVVFYVYRNLGKLKFYTAVLNLKV